MKYTIFETPVVKTIFRGISYLALKMTGWKTEGKLPDVDKFVMIAAPHTSNWDLPYMLFTSFVFKINVYWMGKDAIFNNPFRKLFLYLGGIPVDRSKSNNLVQYAIDMINEKEKISLAVPPSGTRKKVAHWKTGFYHIANGAQVPIVLGFLDYSKKRCGVLDTVMPTGDIEKDMKIIADHYKDIQGKYPEKGIDHATMMNVKTSG